MPTIPKRGRFPGPLWYDSSWKRRHPIAVDAVTGTDSGTVDVEVPVLAEWDWFWDGVQDQTNGYDIIVCGSDGVTLLNFAYSGLNFATRTLTIQIDGLVLAGTGKMECIWLYWYKTSPSDLTSAVTITSPLDGHIEVAGPSGGYLTSFSQEQVDATAPTVQWQKKSTETLYGWVDLSPALSLAGETYNGFFEYEGIRYVTCAEFTPGQLTVTDAGTRYTYYQGRLWVLALISAGASGTDDGVKYTITTTLGRVLDFRVGVTIDDPTQ